MNQTVLHYIWLGTPSIVEIPIYFFYDMDLVDLIIFTVGEP